MKKWQTFKTIISKSNLNIKKTLTYYNNWFIKFIEYIPTILFQSNNLIKSYIDFHHHQIQFNLYGILKIWMYINN